jgi:hypothetical protein
VTAAAQVPPAPGTAASPSATSTAGAPLNAGAPPVEHGAAPVASAPGAAGNRAWTAGANGAQPAAPAGHPDWPLQTEAATAAQPAAGLEPQAPTHNFDFTSLNVPAEDLPVLNDLANHWHAEGGSQEEAERGWRVVQRVRAADEKADAATFNLTATTMRNALGDEFDQVERRMAGWIAEQNPHIQGALRLVALLHPDGFRVIRNFADYVSQPRDLAEPAPGPRVDAGARLAELNKMQGNPRSDYWNTRTPDAKERSEALQAEYLELVRNNPQPPQQDVDYISRPRRSPFTRSR